MNFKNIIGAIGDTVVAMSEHEAKVNEMTNTIMNKTYGVDYEQAKKIARVLVNEAEVTWK